MPPSCSASSAVVSVRKSRPRPLRSRIKKGRCGTRGRKEPQRYNGFDGLLGRKDPANQHTTVYFFVGCILAGQYFYNYIPAAIVAFIGLAYIALEFVPSIEPPANMRYAILDSTCNKTGLEYTLTDPRDADAGWGAEQV
jgi:hypothetical protein